MRHTPLVVAPNIGRAGLENQTLSVNQRILSVNGEVNRGEVEII